MEILFLSITQTAKLLGVHYNTVYRWVKTGKIRSLRIGTKIYRIPVNEVKWLLEKKEIRRQIKEAFRRLAMNGSAE